MSEYSTLSSGDIAFMMGGFKRSETTELLQLGGGMNRKFLFVPSREEAWKWNLPPDFPQPVFAMPFREKTRRIGCWVVGSDTNLEAIDFKVAESNRNGVSKRCLSIDFGMGSAGHPILRVTNMSENAKLIIKHNDFDIIHLEKGEKDEIAEVAVVHHPKFSFWVWHPKRTTSEYEQFRKSVQDLDEEAHSTELLEYWPSLKSEAVTRDDDTRMSANGLMYIKIHGLDRHRGHTSRVFQVRELGKPTLSLCAKELFGQSTPSDLKRMKEESRKEFQLFASLSHPNIAKVIDIAYQHDGGCAPPWLIFEHIPVGLHEITLRKIPRPRVPQLDTVDFMTQLASAIAYIHSEGFVHGDISINNIRMYADHQGWVAKLIDLGYSSAGASDNYPLQGTLGFASPEVLMKHPCSEKIDMFSLGITGLFLFFDIDPMAMCWPGAPDADILVRWMREKVIPLVDSAELKIRTLLGGLLALKPENRWSAQKLLNYLWRLRNASDPEEPVSIASPVLPNEKKRRRESDASTVRPKKRDTSIQETVSTAQATKESVDQSTTGSFKSARSHAATSVPESVPATPFVDDGDSDTEIPDEEHLNLKSKPDGLDPVTAYLSKTEHEWDFSFNLDDWYNDLKPVSDPQTDEQALTPGQSWVTHAYTDQDDSEAETDILPATGITEVDSGVDSGSSSQMLYSGDVSSGIYDWAPQHDHIPQIGVTEDTQPHPHTLGSTGRVQTSPLGNKDGEVASDIDSDSGAQILYSFHSSTFDWAPGRDHTPSVRASTTTEELSPSQDSILDEVVSIPEHLTTTLRDNDATLSDICLSEIGIRERRAAAEQAAAEDSLNWSFGPDPMVAALAADQAAAALAADQAAAEDSLYWSFGPDSIVAALAAELAAEDERYLN